MSDRYTRRPSDGEQVCATCGALVSDSIMHDAFHARFNLMYDAIPVSGESITATDWQAAHDAGEDEELTVPFTYPGERVIATVVQWDTGFGFTVYDKDGNEAASGAGPLLAVIDMLTEGLESYYKEAHDAFCTCDGCNERHGAPVKVEPSSNPTQTEPPVGAVARCFGCGNVYVHKADGWVDSDDMRWGRAWADIARSFCGPVKVIYNPEEDK